MAQQLLLVREKPLAAFVQEGPAAVSTQRSLPAEVPLAALAALELCLRQYTPARCPPLRDNTGIPA